MKTMTYMVRIIYFVVTLVSIHEIRAQNDEISLSGIWSFQPAGSVKTTLQVPGFYVWKLSPKSTLNFPTTVTGPWKIVEGKSEATYETTFQIPATMTGKRIFLHFESVNFLADIYINGNFVTRHIGGYLPFEIDITSIVQVPSSNTLKVAIKYWDSSFVDSAQKPLWPVGFYDNYWGLGITGDVSILARNPVYIENIYVKTSVAEQKIDAIVAVVNADVVSHSILLENQVEKSGSQVLSWSDQSISIPAGDTIEVSLSQNWSNPCLWWPDDPYLYQFLSRVKENGAIQDVKSERFGFRDFKVEGDHFLLNGIKTNLRGDNVTIYSEKQYWYYLTPTPQTWAAILDSMKALNFNVIRLHQSPPPQWMFDLCDEKGMMVIAESALMWRSEVNPYQSAIYAKNGVTWQKKWIRQYRNHPSIVMWSAENEMYVWGGKQCSLNQLIAFADAIEEKDASRPILFDGDKDLDGYADVMSYHYIYGFPKGWPSGSIYTSLGEYVSASKPSSNGEFEWWNSSVAAAEHVRRQCIMSRASRIVGFSDFRPYRLDWAWHPNPNYTDIYNSDWTPSKQQKDLVKTTFNPVAAFDKSFYEYRVDEWTPVYNENDLITRNLVIFNEERANTQVEVRINIWIGETLSQMKSFTLDVPLGEHVERAAQFRAPFVAYDRSAKVEFCTYKNGERKFSETYIYWIQNRGLCPPKKVQQLNVTRQQNGLDITWPAVIQDQDGASETIDRYVLYRSSNCFTTTAGIDSFIVQNQTRFTDTHTSHIGNPALNVYYRIRAVDNTQLTSDLSDIFVDFDYSLKAEGGTNFNQIAIPVNDPELKDAKTLQSRIPTSRSIVRWDAAHQGYEQYIPAVAATNFDLEPGQACWVHSATDAEVDFTGKIATPIYSLSKIENGTSFNMVMLPLDCTNLTMASEMMEDIGNCNSVAKWDNTIQGFVQYDPTVPISDFTITPGYPYLVNITANKTWPNERESGKVVSRQYTEMESDVSHAPHLVWGETVGKPQSYSAYILERPESKLTATSPGCVLDEKMWKVQCAAFQEGWCAGETLIVDLQDQAGKETRFEITLSWNPSDQVENKLERETGHPKLFGLANYPNPFNGQTTIQFTLDKSSHVQLDIINARGQWVCQLVDRQMSPGSFQFRWNAKDNLSRSVPAGLYLARLKAGRLSRIRKMILTN